MFKSAQALVLQAKQSIRECSAEEAEEIFIRPRGLIIDVREPEEYRQGYLQGAINFPRGLLEFKISSDASLQDIDRPILLYCKTGGRSALSAATLQSMGFSNVSSLAGGFDAWCLAGRHVEKPGGAQ